MCDAKFVARRTSHVAHRTSHIARLRLLSSKLSPDTQQNHLKSYPLNTLNQPQREAAEHRDGPLLVLAGAGSGKTRVLAARAANLVHSGAVRPWEILALTFTNKAAGELRARVVATVGVEGNAVTAGTFHSIF